MSPREREVLVLIVEGQRNRDIAQTLGISIKTVEFHRAAIMRKTGAASAVDLVRRAFATRRTEPAF
ncbi:LuxR C-terminal-related transcriptional regulator [Niveibacterium terrae]|uniref:LuxR C-terminal-related transcriptional regulator n=1 Tax=Niveibacterium terrae TaxID=3373598 RepID=UPI003A8EF098